MSFPVELGETSHTESKECVWVVNLPPDAVAPESVVRYYLNENEHIQYCGHSKRRRVRWLRGRVAAKEAVLRLLYQRGAILPSTNQVEIATDENGCPYVEGIASSRAARISIAHSGEFSVSISHEEAVGIDIERIAPHSSGFEMLALSIDELVLLDRCVVTEKRHISGGRSEMLTRFWAAKEAVSKMEGTGLRGNLEAFAITAVDGDCLCVTRKAARAEHIRKYVVQTCTFAGLSDASGASAEYIVAWTRAGWRV